MELTLREGYWIKFCMKLITVIFPDNYYSSVMFLVNRYSDLLVSLLRQFFIILNKINEFINNPECAKHIVYNRCANGTREDTIDIPGISEKDMLDNNLGIGIKDMFLI
jgi:hypothetical protein